MCEPTIGLQVNATLAKRREMATVENIRFDSPTASTTPAAVAHERFAQLEGELQEYNREIGACYQELQQLQARMRRIEWQRNSARAELNELQVAASSDLRMRP